MIHSPFQCFVSPLEQPTACWGRETSPISHLVRPLTPDLSYTTGQLIVTASVGAEYQGIAGGIVMMVVYYSQSIGLGMAATVERYVSGGDQLKGYRAVFWFGTGLAGLAAVIVGLFVRMDKSARLHE